MDCLPDQLNHIPILTDTDYYGIVWVVFFSGRGSGFIAYGWNVLRVGDANDVEALTRAFLAFRQLRPH